MSKKVPVHFRDKFFWAYDVIAGVFLKHLIDAALPHESLRGNEWLADAVRSWRIHAVVPDIGVHFPDDWSEAQVATVARLAATACNVLRQREQIPAEEFTSWPMVDDLRIFPRGLQFVSTAAVASLGDGIVAMLEGTLPEPPAGTSWCYWTESEPGTLPRRKTT